MMPSLVAALTALASLALAVMVGMRAPGQLVNVSFAAALLVVTVAQASYAVALAATNLDVITIFLAVALVAEAVAIPFWLLFSLSFAETNPGAQVRQWRIGLGLAALAAAAVTTVALSTPLVYMARSARDGDAIILSTAGKMAIIVSVLGAVCVLYHLESALRNSRGFARWTIKYMVLGLFGMFAAHVFVAGQQLLFRSIVLEHLSAQSAVSLMSLGIVGFCVVKHRLLDVDIFVSRSVVYGSVTVATVGAYLMALGVAGEIVRRFHISVDFVVATVAIFATAMALVAGLLSERVRRRAKRIIAKNFYRHRYDYRREWTAFTTRVIAAGGLESVPVRVVEWVTETIGTSAAVLWVLDAQRAWKVAAATPGLPSDRLTLTLDAGVVMEHFNAERPVMRLEAGMLGLERASGVKDRLTVLVPLVVKDELVGLLALEPPLGADLSVEDEDLLATAAAQAATVILNARLSEELARSREMDAFHKLSSFIVHDLKNAVAMLSMVTENAKIHGNNPDFQRDAFRTVEDSARQMRQLIGKLSGGPKQGEASQGATGVNRVIQEVVGNSRVAAEGRVRIKEELDTETAAARITEVDLRAIVSNLVLNALEATPSNGEVRVSTTRRGDLVHLEVSDTGCGMSEAFVRESLFVPFRTTKSQGLGVGLFQVKTIIDSVGGKITVDSRDGVGTTFAVDLPAADRRGE
jgi:putative PEP-CTERM system histidine kinase